MVEFCYIDIEHVVLSDDIFFMIFIKYYYFAKILSIIDIFNRL